VVNNKILNLSIFILSFTLLILLFTYLNNQLCIKKYLFPEEIRIISENENFLNNFHLFIKAPGYEKRQIFENYNKFLKLNEIGKVLTVENYIHYLLYDKEKRESLKEIYKDFGRNL
jgi:hypothetical protein